MKTTTNSHLAVLAVSLFGWGVLSSTTVHATPIVDGQETENLVYNATTIGTITTWVLSDYNDANVSGLGSIGNSDPNGLTFVYQVNVGTLPSVPPGDQGPAIGSVTLSGFGNFIEAGGVNVIDSGVSPNNSAGLQNPFNPSEDLLPGANTPSPNPPGGENPTFVTSAGSITFTYGADGVGVLLDGYYSDFLLVNTNDESLPAGMGSSSASGGPFTNPGGNISIDDITDTFTATGSILTPQTSSPVPDGGSTVALLGGVLAGVALLRWKMGARKAVTA